MNSFQVSFRLNHSCSVGDFNDFFPLNEAVTIYRETLSPPSGHTLEIEIVALGSFYTFSLSLKNCSEQPIRVTEYKLKQFEGCGDPFTLEPDTCLTVTSQVPN